MTHLHSDEEMILGVSAKRRMGMRKIDGRLKITSHRILFQPLDPEHANTALTIDLSSVKEVKTARAFKLVPHGLSVSVNTNEHYHFSTDKHERLLKALRGQLTTRLFYIPDEQETSDSS